MVENVYGRLLVEMGRVGLKHGRVALASTYYRGGGIIVVRDNDPRFERLDVDPNYETIGTYTGQPLPTIEQIAGDIIAFTDEQAKKHVQSAV